MDLQIFQEVLSKAREVYMDGSSSKDDDIADVNVERYQLRPKAREFYDFLEHLSFDDLIDLCAYADYGREHYRMREKTPNMEEYISKRKRFFTDHRNTSEHKDLVNYLISKKSCLYLFLDYAKPLLETVF